MSKFIDDHYPQCPSGDYLCPYYDSGDCVMYRIDRVLPYDECDAFFEDEEWEEEEEEEEDDEEYDKDYWLAEKADFEISDRYSREP